MKKRVIKIIEKYPILSLLILVALMLLPSLNHLQVTIMEARNFISAREMLGEGNWILTTMNGEPRYEKPPLPTWITAFFGLLFGIKNVFALRFPGIIMVWIIGAYTYLFSNKMLNNKQHSFINSLIVVTSFYVIGIIIEAPWDIYTHAFMLIAIYHLHLAYTINKNKHIVIAVLFITFSVLSKGPISVYVLLLPFLIAYPLAFGIKNRFIGKTILALIPGILLGSIWFFYVRIADPEAFLKIASVETSNWTSYQVKPFYYYWSFFIQSGIWTIPGFVSLLYPYLKTRVSNLKGYRLSLLSTLFSVVLLSLIPEKKARYLIPALILLAINTGFYIQYLITHFKQIKSKWETIPVYFNFGLLGIISFFAPIATFIFKDDTLTKSVYYLVPVSILLITTSGFILYHLYLKNILKVFYLSVLLFAVLLLFVVPVNSKFSIQNEEYKSISTLKTEAENEHINVYLLDIISPEMLWDYGDIIPKVKYKNGSYILPVDNKFGLLVNDEKIIEEGDFNKNYIITKIDSYDLNIQEKNNKSYKSRLLSHYYIFQKK